MGISLGSVDTSKVDSSDISISPRSMLDMITLRAALSSNEPAVIEALDNLKIIAKLYHADIIAEDMEDTVLLHALRYGFVLRHSNMNR